MPSVKQVDIAVIADDQAQVTGDVTDMVYLWDAGTEANQEPGLGADQAPRQSAGNTGAADSDSNVRRADDTFGNLPAVSDVIRVIAPPAGQSIILSADLSDQKAVLYLASEE